MWACACSPRSPRSPNCTTCRVRWRVRSKSQRTGAIGLIIPNHTNPYFLEVARGIEDRCYRAGYSVILCNFGDDAARRRNYLNVLLGKRCDGLIMAALEPADGELLQTKKIPVLLLDRAPRGQSFDVVDVDNVAGGALAVQHLLALGRRRIACIGGPAEIALSRLRSDGVREMLAGAGLSLAPALCRHADFASMGGYQQARALLALPAVQRPDAIFAATT